MKHMNRMAVTAVAAAFLAAGCTAAGPSSTTRQQATLVPTSTAAASTQSAAGQTVGIEQLNGRWKVSFKLTSANPCRPVRVSTDLTPDA